jgi:hypothetical protein
MIFSNFKKNVTRKIQEEKNIKIRERIEQRFQRQSNVLLTILLAGSAYGSIKNVFSAIAFIIELLVILAVWMFVENYFLFNYSKYTDELIEKESKK